MSFCEPYPILFHFCILGNERMEVMKGAHLLISCTHICVYVPFLSTSLWHSFKSQAEIEHCEQQGHCSFFSVHSDFASYYYNLLQQPQKRGRKLEGAKGEPDSI